VENVLTAEDVRVEEKRLAGGREGTPSRKSVGSGRRKNRNKRMRSGRNGKKQSSRKRRKRKVRKS
jgi:hypothetical protein